jgi:hypothetical protein
VKIVHYAKEQAKVLSILRLPPLLILPYWIWGINLLNIIILILPLRGLMAKLELSIETNVQFTLFRFLAEITFALLLTFLFRRFYSFF